MAFTLANLCYQPVASVTFNSVDTGATFDGVKVAWSSEYISEGNDQSYGDAFQKLIKRGFEIEWMAHEAQLANLALSIGMPSSAVSAATLSLNNNETAAASLIITGVAGTGPTNKVRTWTFTQAVPMGSGDISIVRNGTARPPMKFKALFDNSTSKYGTCVDV